METQTNEVDFEKDEEVLKSIFGDELGEDDRQIMLTYDEKNGVFWLVRLGTLNVRQSPVNFNVQNTNVHNTFLYRNGISQYDLIGRLITYLVSQNTNLGLLIHLNYDEILDELLELTKLSVYDMYAPKYFFKEK